MQNIVKKIILLSSITLLGCSSNVETLLPQDGKTMAQVYAEQTGGAVSSGSEPLSQNVIQARSELNVREATLAQYQMQIMQYTRNAENEVKNLFPRLQNPDLVMFVFPHLANENGTEAMPIPGYSTVFPMFGTQKYAQAGDALTGL